jgi:hypothetical protein
MALLAAALPCRGQLVWTGNVDNAWDLTTANWLSGGTPATYADGADVLFTDRTAQPTINVTRVVFPNSTAISNTTARLLTFTNNVMGGSGAVTKDGNGTARFGNSAAQVVYSNSFPFTGGTLVRGGTLAYYLGNTDDTAKASGGVPFGFGTGAITLAAPSATFAFSGWKGSCQLTNNIEVTGGGTLDLGRYDSQNSSWNNFSGNIALRSTNAFLIKPSYTAYGDPRAGRVFAGATTLHTNALLALYNQQYTTRSLAYEQSIAVADASYSLRLNGQGVSPIEMSGNNAGVVAGMTLLPHTTYATAPVLFLSSNALGGGVVNVSSGAYAGLQFNVTPDVFSRISFDHGSALGIESNTAVNIDLSAGGINRDIWLGSMRGAVYSGTLTPYGSVYRFGGGGCIDQSPVGGSTLTLANTNALSGSRAVVVGDPNALLQPGVLALAASNSFSGGMTLNSARCTGITGSSPNASPSLISRAQGALGSGGITINRTSNLGGPPTLQFEAVSQTVANDILILGAYAQAAITSAAPTLLSGNLTATGGTNINIQVSAAASSVLIFDQAAAGHAVTLGDGSLINHTSGLFDPRAGANLPLNAGYRMDVSAALVLSPGFAWSDLTDGRTWVNSPTPGAAQWTGRNFVGRGAPQTVDRSGAFQSGFANTWLDQSILLGSAVTNADGSFYANAGVKIARDFTITGDRVVTVASTGPGLTNASTFGFVNEIAGTVDGPGMLRMGGTGVGTDGQVPELVLSGTSVWSGSVNMDYQNSQRVISGPGGLGIVQASPGAFLRFSGNASIPANNGGVSAYLAALGRTYTADRFGYLLTGTPGGETYALRPGYRFLLGGTLRAVLGSTSGRATLADAMVSIWRATSATTAHSLALLTRDQDAVLTLGSATGAVRFSSCYCGGNASPLGLQPEGTPGTPMVERTATNTLVKRGPGTLVLRNVQYTQIDGTGDTTTNFIWQIGSASGQYDGAVRVTGTGPGNSLGFNQAVTFGGGVIELGGGDWAAQLGTTNGCVDLFGVTGSFGSGFAAHGGHRVVSLINPPGVLRPTYHYWGDAAYRFVAVGRLLFGSYSADNLIELRNTNHIAFNQASRTIYVIDNPASSNDMALISGSMGKGVGASTTTALIKDGPGILILSSTNLNWESSTVVTAGTLCVDGVLVDNTVSNVIVCGGATLCGTGVVYRPVVVQSNGIITAGSALGPAGTLTVASMALQGGAAAAFSLDGSAAYPRVNVLSDLTLAGTLRLNFTARPAGGMVFDLFDWGGSHSGAFDTIVVSGVVPPGRVNTDHLYSTGEIRIRGGDGVTVIVR